MLLSPSAINWVEMDCKNAERVLCGLAWLNVHSVDHVLFQEVNEVRSTLLDRCEARGRS